MDNLKVPNSNLTTVSFPVYKNLSELTNVELDGHKAMIDVAKRIVELQYTQVQKELRSREHGRHIGQVFEFDGKEWEIFDMQSWPHVRCRTKAGPWSKNPKVCY